MEGTAGQQGQQPGVGTSEAVSFVWLVLTRCWQKMVGRAETNVWDTKKQQSNRTMELRFNIVEQWFSIFLIL